MTAIGKFPNSLTGVLIVGLCLIVAIAVLYINFNDFVMPFPLIIGILIVCAIVSTWAYIGYLKNRNYNKRLAASIGAIIMLLLLGVITFFMIAMPIVIMLYKN